MCQRRALIVCSAGIMSGKEIMSLALARGLRERGWNVEFAVSCWNNGDFVAKLREEQFAYSFAHLGFLGISLRWKPLEWTLVQMGYWPTLLREYRRLIARLAPDLVIHTNWHHALLLAPLLDKSRDLYWSHELIPSSAHYGYAFRAIGKRVAAMVCVSQAVARSLAAIGIPQSHIAVVHNGTGLANGTPSPHSQLPLRLGIIGQIAPWKGHEDLFAAIAL